MSFSNDKSGKASKRVLDDEEDEGDGDEEEGDEDEDGDEEEDEGTLDEYFTQGWYPYHLKVPQRSGQIYEYVILRKGQSRKSLGRYSDELWASVKTSYEDFHERKAQITGESVPELTDKDVEEGKKFEEELPKSLGSVRDAEAKKEPKIRLGSQLRPPSSLPRSIEVELQTLMYYEWAKQRGYPGDLGKFMNETVQLFFKEQNIEPVIFIIEQPILSRE